MRVVLCHYGQTAELLFCFGLGNVLQYSLLHALFQLVNLRSLTQFKRVCRNAHSFRHTLIKQCVHIVLVARIVFIACLPCTACFRGGQ